MIREFEALVRVTETLIHDSGGNAAARVTHLASGNPFTITRAAEGEDQVRAEMAACGLHVVGITEIRPVVDWTMPVFDRDEAAAYLRWKAGTLSANKGDGEIPCADIGGGRYPRAALEAYVNSKLNPAGKELLAA